MIGKGVGNGIKYLKNKLPTLLSLGHFWTNFGYGSQVLAIQL